MTTKNEANSNAYRDNYDKIFKAKNKGEKK